MAVPVLAVAARAALPIAKKFLQRLALRKITEKIQDVIGKIIKFLVALVAGGCACAGTLIVVVIAAIAFFLILIVTVIVTLLGSAGGGAAIEPPIVPGDGAGIISDYCLIKLVAPPCSVELERIFEEAGAWAKIPAGVLVGIASIEGGQIFGYTDAEILDFSKDSGGSGIDGQGIDPANSTPNQCGAIGPMQFLVDSSVGYPPLPPSNGTCDAGRALDVWSRYKPAVNVAGIRTLSNPDARSIINAIYGAAWKLKCNSGAPAGECSSGTFTKFDYNDPTDAWEFDEEVTSAARAYYGSCDAIVVNYCELVWNVYQAVADTGSMENPSGNPTWGSITQGPYYPDPAETHSPVYKGTGYFRSALDIANVTGTEIFSTHGGIITKIPDAADTWGFGTHVVITGQNYITIYAHMEKFSNCVNKLNNGDYIEKGKIIGYMNTTGAATGSHLHYQINKVGSVLPLYGDVITDPAEFDSVAGADYKTGSVSSSYLGVDCPP